MTWLRSSIINVSGTIQPLIDALERSYSLSTNRTKRSLQCILLSDINWGQIELNSYNRSKEVLRYRATLSRRDEIMTLFMLMSLDPTGLILRQKLLSKMFIYHKWTSITNP